jgi:hypothetical protein
VFPFALGFGLLTLPAIGSQVRRQIAPALAYSDNMVNVYSSVRLTLYAAEIIALQNILLDCLPQPALSIKYPPALRALRENIHKCSRDKFPDDCLVRVKSPNHLT